MRIGDKLNFQRRIACAIQLRCHCVLLYLISAFSTPLRTVPGRVISIQPSTAQSVIQFLPIQGQPIAVRI